MHMNMRFARYKFLSTRRGKYFFLSLVVVVTCIFRIHLYFNTDSSLHYKLFCTADHACLFFSTAYNCANVPAKQLWKNLLDHLKDPNHLFPKFRASIHRHWPPDDREVLRDPCTGFYDLTLRPWVVEDPNLYTAELLKFQQFRQALRQLSSPNQSNLQHLHGLHLRNESDRSNWPRYDFYPQLIDMNVTINAVKKGMSVKQKPINDPELWLLRTPITACFNFSSNKSHTIDLVVLVKSGVYNFDRRQDHRNSYMRRHLWGDFRIQFAFVVGLPTPNATNRFFINGVNITLGGRAGKLLLDYSKHDLEVANRLKNESDTYGDLIIGSFYDTYYNLTLKMITTFRWATTFCLNRVPIILSIDDDFAVVPKNLISYIRSIPLNEKLTQTSGMLRPSSPVIRPQDNFLGGRWAVKEQEIPWSTYPSHYFGPGYFVGAELMKDMAIGMAFVRYYRIDDVYIGIVVTKMHTNLLRNANISLDFKSANSLNHIVASSLDRISKFIDWETGQISTQLPTTPTPT